MWTAATELGIAVQLHFEPRYAPGFERYIRDFPDTKVLIDHLGRPFQGTPEEYARVLAFARYPNTIMKLSAVPTARQYPHREIGPVLKQIVNAWGPDRLMYGGGFGAGATASPTVPNGNASAPCCPIYRADQDKVLGGNAVRLFRLGT